MEKKTNIGKDRRKAIVQHASEIYLSMPGKQSVHDQNIKGQRAQMFAAIELAEMFDAALEEAGYDGADRINGN